MNSLVFGNAASSWEIRLLRKYGWNRWILRHLPRTIFRRGERTFLPRGVQLPADVRADLWNTFRRREVRAFVSKICAGYQSALARLPELYPRIECPTLVLWAERDKHFPLVQAERLHATLSKSRLEVVNGGEHWMAWHAAEEVARRICVFARET